MTQGFAPPPPVSRAPGGAGQRPAPTAVTTGTSAPAGERASHFFDLATRAATHSGGLSDAELLELLAEHRWAVGQLARPRLDIHQRTVLNAAVLKTHGLLHPRPRRTQGRMGRALLRVQGAVLLTTAVFVGSAVLAASVVVADPVLAYSLVPRQMLVQIDAHAWGSRGSHAADAGMMFFYWGNNLRAAFMALGLGVVGGVLGLLVIAFNGAMLGVVAAIAVMRGVGDRLLSWIAPHGVLEIGAVLLCGAIGVELGRSWIEPGWHRRRAALAEAGRALAPLALVAALMIICAAPLEGFVAPLGLPWWADGSFPIAWLLLLWFLARRALRAATRTSDGC